MFIMSLSSINTASWNSIKRSTKGSCIKLARRKSSFGVKRNCTIRGSDV